MMWTFRLMCVPFSPKIHLLCMLVVKKMGAWVAHMRKSVMARFIINMLAGVLRVRLLQTHNIVWREKSNETNEGCKKQ